ncbi:carbohydrate-binding module family 13 protein [Serendipita vermifera MAFF 305830]|uniref:Carbohydrate-binding module family 13 protein n=1 Tax=Serendipita vermifera MAFF 305830 TaxID=933852 RepID=A0A0C3AYB5_SERVB|nr:carbohydrate-binding module family 13 protein [Serendipita vermifera MAFF 305830]
MTGDINAGRSGDYLYVIWRTAEYNNTTPLPNGIYVITNKASKTVVDLAGGNRENGTRIQGWSKATATENFFNQNWYIQKVGNERYYVIRNIKSGTCMDIEGAKTEDGTKVHGWQGIDGVRSQYWYIEGNEHTGYSIVNIETQTVLDLFGGNTADGTSILGYRSWGGANQLWSFESRTLSAKKVEDLLKANPYTKDFRSYNSDRM